MMARNSASTQDPYREARKAFEARHTVPSDLAPAASVPNLVANPAEFEEAQDARQAAVQRAAVAAIFRAVLPHVGRHVDSVA